MKLQLLAAASAAAALIALPAAAQTEAGRWSFSLETGADFPIEGELNGARSVQIPDFGVVNSDFDGAPFIIRVNPVNFNDVYDTAWAFGGEAGYGLSDNSEVFGALRYSKASGSTTQFGRLQDVETTQTAVINANFDDHEVWTLDLGYRHYFGEGNWKPYMAGRVGAAFTNGITASFSTPGGELAVDNVTFYDDSWSWTLGADLGVDYSLNERWSIQGEVGLRYISDLSDQSGPGLVNLGLSDLNKNSGSTISAPVMIRGKYTW